MNASKVKQIGAPLLRKHRCNYAFDLPSVIAASDKVLVRKLGFKMSIANHSSTQRRFLSSSSRGSNHKGNGKKPRVKLSTPGSESIEALWCTSASPSSSALQTKSLEMGRYGLKRLDYATMKPPIWTTPPHPPTKTMAERLVFPLSIVAVAGIVLWVFMSPEEDDMTEYWKRVESGQILLHDDDDDDDDDEDDDDDDDDDDGV